MGWPTRARPVHGDSCASAVRTRLLHSGATLSFCKSSTASICFSQPMRFSPRERSRSSRAPLSHKIINQNACGGKEAPDRNKAGVIDSNRDQTSNRHEATQGSLGRMNSRRASGNSLGNDGHICKPILGYVTDALTIHEWGKRVPCDPYRHARRDRDSKRQSRPNCEATLPSFFDKADCKRHENGPKYQCNINEGICKKKVEFVR